MGAVFSGKRLLLFVIPLYAVILSCILLRNFSPFYLSEPDPCYCYLFNGMHLAGGSANEQAVSNLLQPGATIQTFASVIIFVRNLPFFPHPPVYQDVISNTESYLYTCSIALIVLFIFINYLVGAYMFRHTRNIGLSIIFQMAPLINMNIMRRVVVLEPESLIIIASTFFMAYLFLRAPGNGIKTNKPFNTKTIAVFALFSGFLIASKYTCAPVIFLVLCILQNNKQRLMYIGMMLLSFLIFLIPILPSIESIFQWMRSVSIHEIMVGSNPAQEIHFSQFLTNLEGIFLTDTVFTSIYALITIAFVVCVVKRIKTKESVPFLGIISGTWLSITLLILAVTKNPDFHYLIFAECCFPLGLAVSYKILSPYLTLLIGEYKRHKKAIVFSFFGLFAIFLVIEKIRYIPFKQSKCIGINKYIDNYKTIPLVISVKSGLACERVEPALFLGYMFSTNLQPDYARFLNREYPNTYIYWSGRHMLSHWDGSLSINEFMNKNKTVLVYLKGYDDTTEVNIMRQFSACNSSTLPVQYNRLEVYRDAETMQSISLMTEADGGDGKEEIANRVY